MTPASQDPSGADRRQWPRMDIALTVRFNARDFGELYAGVAGNISMGGVYLKTSNPRPIGTAVDLVLDLEVEKQSLHCNGVVVRSIPVDATRNGGPAAGMAIKFTGFDEGDDKVLAYLLQTHERDQLTCS